MKLAVGGGQWAVGSRQWTASARQWAVALGVVALVGCSSGPPPPDSSSYVSEIATARDNLDKQFRQQPDEPIPPAKMAALLPLRYYPIDPAYRIPAVLQLSDERPVFEMPTSTGTLRRYQLVGSLAFTFQGQPHTLGAFVPAGEAIVSLFVPFADLTTGTETYSAGRYLDVHPTSTGYYTIDFNRAYNPYCAYNATYECPFPPASNRLKIPVTAGEKTPGA